MTTYSKSSPYFTTQSFGKFLDIMDQRYLNLVATSFGGGPVGIETIAAALSEPRDAIEDIIEPYLIQQGFVQRTPRGRVATAHAWQHFGLAMPAGRTPELATPSLVGKGIGEVGPISLIPPRPRAPRRRGAGCHRRPDRATRRGQPRWSP